MCALEFDAELWRVSALYRAIAVGVEYEGQVLLVSGRALHLKGRLAEDEHGFVLRTPSLTK